ncbi:MAG: hypothetical protein ACFBZ8_09765 [Opitutales bacterium]
MYRRMLSLFAASLALFSVALSATTPAPVWTQRPLRPGFTAVVTNVVEGPRTGTYIVRVTPGLETGFTTGMLCEVRRAGNTVATLVLVQAELEAAAGLVTSGVGPESLPAIGDAVRPRVGSR